MYHKAHGDHTYCKRAATQPPPIPPVTMSFLDDREHVGRYTYKCPCCEELFKYKSELMKHLLTHATKNHLPEVRVPKVKTHLTIPQHPLGSDRKSDTAGGNISLPVGMSTSRRPEIQASRTAQPRSYSSQENSHKSSIVRTKLYKFSYCQAVSLNKSELLQHIKSHIVRNNKKTVPEVEGTLKAKNDLQMKDNAKVDICAQISEKRSESQTNTKPSRENASEVELDTNGDTPHICIICSKEFKTWEAVDTHIQLHMKTRKHSSPNKKEHTPENYQSMSDGWVNKNSVPQNIVASPQLREQNDEQRNQKPYTCSHIITTQGKFMVCQLCEKVFCSSSEFKFHSSKKTYKYFCYVCNEGFQLSADYHGHMTSHSGQRRSRPRHKRTNTRRVSYKCGVCREAFMDRNTCRLHVTGHVGLASDLINEMVIDSDGKVYNCPDCDRQFLQLDVFESHMMTHTGARPFMCALCGKQFIQESSYKKHLMIHTQDKTKSDEKFTNAPKCQEKFTVEANLIAHSSSHTGENHYTCKWNHYTCSTCGKRFTGPFKLKSHMAIHTKDKPEKCSQCGKRYKRTTDLKRHMVVHTGQKPHYCTQCGKQFTYAWELNEHLMVHKRPRARHKCSHCNKQFVFELGLKKHLINHTRQRLYTCFQCGKQFTLAGSLRSHMSVHMAVKPHCDKAFKAEKNSRLHMRTHSGQKPHLCTNCGKRFLWLKSFKRHIMTHKRDRDARNIFKCPLCDENVVLSKRRRHVASHKAEMSLKCLVCGERFKQVSLCDSHMTTHKGPYTCSICANTFPRLAVLKGHMMTHLEKVSYPCFNCGEQFRRLAWLKTHLKVHGVLVGETDTKLLPLVPVVPFLCTVCVQGFLHPSDLSKHLKQSHVTTFVQLHCKTL